MSVVRRIWPSPVERAILTQMLILVVLVGGLFLFGLIDDAMARIVAFIIWVPVAAVELLHSYVAIAKQRPSSNASASERARWASVRVGDRLIARADVHVKTHRKWWSEYPSNRQFTAGKAYPVIQTRQRTGVVFVFDDAHFRIALDHWQGRRFDVERVAKPCTA